MFEVIQINEATASDRRIFFSLVDSTDGITPKDITTTGVKARISKNGAALAATTNDITKITDSNSKPEYYIELTAAEVDTLGQIRGYIDTTGCAKAPIQATIVNYDPFASGLTAASVAAAVWDEARASHTTAGTFGQGAASVQGNVTGSVASVTGNVAGNVVGSVGSIANGGIVAATFGADAINAAALAADAGTEIAAAVFARAFSAAYGSHTFDELMKLIVSVLVGKVSGIDTGAPLFRNLADTANVVSATVDANGNRSAVTRTP